MIVVILSFLIILNIFLNPKPKTSLLLLLLLTVLLIITIHISLFLLLFQPNPKPETTAVPGPRLRGPAFLMRSEGFVAAPKPRTM